jgi:hypothetical protein
MTKKAFELMENLRIKPINRIYLLISSSSSAINYEI